MAVPPQVSQTSVSPESLVVIRHPSLRRADNEAWQNLGIAVAKASEEFTKLRGGDPRKLPEFLRATLIKRIEGVITLERVSQISASEDSGKQEVLVRALADDIVSFVRNTFHAFGKPYTKGRPRRFARRDSKIYEMREEGCSYGYIAKKLRIKRLAVQAAYRREIERRKEFDRVHTALKAQFAPLGIVFQEANTTSEKSMSACSQSGRRFSAL